MSAAQELFSSWINAQTTIENEWSGDFDASASRLVKGANARMAALAAEGIHVTFDANWCHCSGKHLINGKWDYPED